MHAQNDLFCAPESMGTDVRAAAPNGGYLKRLLNRAW